MPAVTTDDRSALAACPTATGTDRSVVSVTGAISGREGNGFPVHRAFAGVDTSVTDPFIHMDEMGEVVYEPGKPVGTPWHPHRGFETVTYMIDGEMAHRDSNGGGGLISDGDTQWMTAGAGILHIEEPPPHVVSVGGVFHGVQLWVNLPAKDKMVPSGYQSIDADQVTLLSADNSKALLRVIAGAVGEHTGPGSTHSPINVVHASLDAGSSITIPWPTDFNAMAYVMNGLGSAGSGDSIEDVETSDLAVFGEGDSITITAAESQATRTGAMEVMLLGGKPIGEPIAWQGPFVMNAPAELRQAFIDFEDGKMGTIPPGELT